MRHPELDFWLRKIISPISSVNLVFIFILNYLYLLFYPKKAVALPQPSSTKLATPIPLGTQKIPEKMILSRIQLIDNQIIPPAEINQALESYLFQPISFTELLEIQQIITQLYVERGYLTTGAFIPPQTITNRTLKIQIIPGRISEINISGLKKLHPEYIRSRIAIASEAPLNHNRLLAALQVLQLNPLIENISAELSQGIEPGESFLKLKIEEADSFNLKLNLDNDLTSSIGSIRSQVSVNEQNMFGFGDTFNLIYASSEGSESLEKLEYIAPIGARGTYLRASHNQSDNQIILDPFRSLDLANESLGYEVTLIQDLINQPTQNFSLAFAFTHQNSLFSIMDLGFPDLARGLDDEGRSIISSLRFIQNYSQRHQNDVFLIASQFALGIDAFNSTINNNELPDSKYLLWRGQVRYLRAISATTNLSLQAIAQFADRPLLAQEQFLVGGMQSVRGYSKDIIQGDNGISFSTELNHTALEIPQWDLRLVISPFFDFGRIWNSDDFLIETNTLASVGIATELSIKENLNARIDFGIPLINDQLSTGNSLQEKGIHFSLNVQPF